MMGALIRRSPIYNVLPQYPGWFNSKAHIRARSSFLEKLKSKYRYETVEKCPLCSSSQTRLIAAQERHGLPINVVMCTECTLLRTSPRLTAESMLDHYKSDAQTLKRGDSPQVSDMLFNLQKAKGEKIERFLKSSETAEAIGQKKIESVLEVGCGEGGAISVLKEAFPRAVGYELNPEAVEYGKRLGLDLRCSPFTQACSEYFDLVIYEQTLEHIHDVHKEIARLREAQRPGDLFYIAVPGLLNIEKGYSGNLIAYLEYQHMHHFTLSTLEQVLACHGYQLLHGTEEIEALFVRTEMNTVQDLRIKKQSAEEICEFLTQAERGFKKHKSADWPNSLRFAAKLILSRARMI